jgi:hypothetical protein
MHSSVVLPYFSPISEINKSYLNRKRQSYVCGKNDAFFGKCPFPGKPGVLEEADSFLSA